MDVSISTPLHVSMTFGRVSRMHIQNPLQVNCLLRHPSGKMYLWVSKSGLGTAGSAPRSATPSRLALEAIFGRSPADDTGCWDGGRGPGAWPVGGPGPPAPAQVAGGPPGSRIDLGLRAPTTAKKGRNVVGIERVVFGLAPREGFHVEGVTQHDGNPLLSTEISQPVPGEEPFDTDADIRARGRDGLEQRFWGCWPVTVHLNLPHLVHDAEGPGCGRARRSHHNTGAAWWRIA